MTLAEYGIVVLSMFSAVTLLHQAWKVWSTRRAVALDAPQIFFVFIGFASLVVYGMVVDRAPMMFSGLLRAPITVVLLVGIWLFGTVTLREWWYCAGLGLLTVALFTLPTAYLDDLFLGISVTLVFASCRLPMKLRSAGTRGTVQLPMLVTYDLIAVFWTIYGFAEHDPLVWAPSFAFLVIYTYSIYLWWVSPPLLTHS